MIPARFINVTYILGTCFTDKFARGLSEESAFFCFQIICRRRAINVNTHRRYVADDLIHSMKQICTPLSHHVHNVASDKV